MGKNEPLILCIAAVLSIAATNDCIMSLMTHFFSLLAVGKRQGEFNLQPLVAIMLRY